MDTPHFYIRDILQLQPFRPGLQLRLVQAAIEHPAIHDLGARGAGPEPRGRLSQTAAAGGGKKNDGFSSKVIGLQEGIEDTVFFKVQENQFSWFCLNCNSVI